MATTSLDELIKKLEGHLKEAKKYKEDALGDQSLLDYWAGYVRGVENSIAAAISVKNLTTPEKEG